jgi:hypothetical protein
MGLQRIQRNRSDSDRASRFDFSAVATFLAAHRQGRQRDFRGFPSSVEARSAIARTGALSRFERAALNCCRRDGFLGPGANGFSSEAVALLPSG